jgi:hypothetical protein
MSPSEKMTPYKAEMRDGKPYVVGPRGYKRTHLSQPADMQDYSESSFSDLAEAQLLADHMNYAYGVGYMRRRQEEREFLGLPPDF